METTKKTYSNIQLLRIMLFIMIVFLHVSSLGLVTSSFQYKSVSWFYTFFMRVFVSPAVMTFVTLGGYVSQFNNNIDIKNKFKKYFFPIACYLPFLIYLMNIGYSNDSFIKDVIINFFTFKGTFYHLWYIILYFPVAIIFPIIKKGIDSLPQKYIKMVILICFLLFSINSFSPFLIDTNIFNGYFNNVFLSFILMYSIGYCIGKYNINIKSSLAIILLFIFYFIMALLFKFTVNEGMVDVSFLANNNVIVGCLAILWLLLFKNIKLKSNLVNYIGNLTFGAYINHVFFIGILTNVFNYSLMFSSKYYIFYDIIYVLMVIFCSLTMESIRKKMLEIINKRRRD